MEHICICNNCDELYFDTNPQINAKKFDISGLSSLESHKCPICKTDEFLSDDVYVKLWGMLGDVCVNEDDEIDEDFLHFEKGTDKFEIWHWFEETFNISVAKDLMFLE